MNFFVSLQALGLQDSDDEAEAEEKAVEEVSPEFIDRFTYLGSLWDTLWHVTLSRLPRRLTVRKIA